MNRLIIHKKTWIDEYGRLIINTARCGQKSLIEKNNLQVIGNNNLYYIDATQCFTRK